MHNSDGHGGWDDDDEERNLVKRRNPPIRHKWNLVPCILFLCCLGT